MPQPEVVWSTSYTWAGTISSKYLVEGIFTEDSNFGNYWLTSDEYTGHGFTIKLSSCTVSIVGIRVKNIAHRPEGNLTIHH